MKQNILYAHSGGITAALNATAAGVISASQKHKELFGDVYIPHFGLHGINEEKFYSTNQLTQDQIKRLYHTPSSVFGTSRFKLPDPEIDPTPYQNIYQVFKKYNIGYFLYNGGGDSQDTTHKISRFLKMCQLPIQTIGIPKTIDNDLCGTDHSPGFGSSAKYIALSTLEAAIDTRAMSQSSTKAFVLEVMGRNSGWLAASSALAKSEHSHAPHIILLPERNVAPTDILNKVKATIDDEGYCVIVVAEGFHLNKLASTKSEACDFGHKRLGGVGQALSELIQNNLGIKTRYANADYLQRAVGHCASATDLDIAYQTGVGAVLALKNGMNNKLIGIRHTSHSPFQWEHYFTSINEVANHEKHLPNEFISPCNMHVTDAFIQYARPLISGEVQVPYHNNIPNYLHNSELSLIKLPKEVPHEV